MSFESPLLPEEPTKEVPSPGNQEISELKKEKEKNQEGEPLPIEFYVTDHNTRHPEDVSLDSMRSYYRELHKEGISSIRFDWDWDETFPEPGRINQEAIDRYIAVTKIMREEGMEAPTFVLSAPPTWANELYKQDKEKYFEAYTQYVNTATEAMKRSGNAPVQAQLFNEINHPLLFRFIDLEDFPRSAEIVRKAFQERDMDVKLSTSFILSNTSEMSAAMTRRQKLDGFLGEFEKIKDSVDVVSLDYYPGMWHVPIKKPQKAGDAFPIPPSWNPVKELGNRVNRTFKDTEMLEEVCKKVAGWGKEYEIGESGFPTNEPYSQGRRQRLFYDMYFRGLRQMIVDLSKQGIALPKRVGLYEVQDEENKLGQNVDNHPFMKWIKKRKIFPEAHFGLLEKTGDKKEILKGRMREGKAIDVHEGERSQLRTIIDYLKRPVDVGEKEEE